MAAVDRLLQAVLERQLDALVLTPDEPAHVRQGGESRPLTRSALDASTIERMLAELVPGGMLPPAGGFELEHRVDDTTFRVDARLGDAGWVATATPLGDAAAGDADDAVSTADAAAGDALTETPAPATPAPATPVPAVGAAGSRSLPSFDELLSQMVEAGASDLHLSAGQAVRLRVDGSLVALDAYDPPSSEEIERIVEPATPTARQQEFEGDNDTDFSYELAGRGRFRVNLFRQRLGVGAVCRLIPEQMPSFEKLGLPDSLRRVVNLSKGLVLVTGPTGSGKSTTLAAVLDQVNRRRRDHIITIEDPIEFVHPSKGCLVNQREVGTHTGSFHKALRAALREDPDIILVGEMRDLETTAMAIETAETGHLVFGTLHTTTAASTVERIIDQFPTDRQGQIRMMLAESLELVVSQSLLRRIGGGRVAAFEVLVCTPAVSNLIREGKTFQIASAMQTGQGQGMRTLNQALAELVADEVVEPAEAYRKAVDKDGFLGRLEKAGISFDPASLDDEPAG